MNQFREFCTWNMHAKSRKSHFLAKMQHQHTDRRTRFTHLFPWPNLYIANTIQRKITIWKEKTLSIQKHWKIRVFVYRYFFCTFLPLFYKKLFVVNCLRKILKFCKNGPPKRFKWALQICVLKSVKFWCFFYFTQLFPKAIYH